jgi:hypothetical protein
MRKVVHQVDVPVCEEGKEEGRAGLVRMHAWGKACILHHDPGVSKSEHFLKGMERPVDEPLLV